VSETVAYPSAARTATPTVVTFDLARIRALVVVIDVTAVGVTPSVVPLIEGVDVASGKSWTLLQGAALVAVGTTVLKIAPGLVAAANLVACDVVPERIRLTMTHGNGVTITYIATAHLIS
jgi:hypothetical protein